MRQSWSGSVIENGAFYITKVDVFRQEQSRLAGRIGIYTMASEHLTEIDEPEDWVAVERLLRQRHRPELHKLKVLICDVDGTLTDGAMYYSPEGEAPQAF